DDGVDVDLLLEARVRAVEQVLAVEVRVLRDAVDFQQQLLDFSLQVLAVVRRRDVRRAFDREGADALQDVRRRLERALGDLRRVRRVLYVARALVETVDLRLQRLGDGETRRIVRRGVDAKTARQPRYGRVERALVTIEIEACAVRQQIVGD